MPGFGGYYLGWEFVAFAMVVLNIPGPLQQILKPLAERQF